MPLVKYRIYELSARAVISYGRQQDGYIRLPSQRRRDREMQITFRASRAGR